MMHSFHLTVYKVRIKTCSGLGAGTNAEVMFKIRGHLLNSNGAQFVSTTPVKLDTPNHDDFERGK